MAGDIRSKLYHGLRNRGLDHTTAIAALANAGAESSFNPTAFNAAGGGKGAHGFWQWRGDRYTGLVNMAEKTGRDPYDPENQMDWMVAELRGNERGTLDSLAGVHDPIEAARIFRDKFERPGGHGYESTKKHASELSSMFGHGLNGPYEGSPGYNRQPRESALRDFSTMSNVMSDKFTEVADGMLAKNMEKAVEKANQPTEMLATNMPTPVVRNPIGFNLPEQQILNEVGIPVNARMPSDPALSFGPSGAVGDVGWSMGEAVPGAAPEGFGIVPSTAPGTFPVAAGGGAPTSSAATTATKSEAPEDLARKGFIDKLSGMLYPDAEDPKSEFKKLVGGLGVGLGQIAQGQAVDLQPYFANIAAGRQAAIQAQQDAEQQQFDNKMSMMNAETQRMNADMARNRLQFDMEEAGRDRAPLAVGLAPEMIDKYEAIPGVAPFLPMIASADPEAQKIGLQGFKEAVINNSKSKATTPEGQKAIADLYEAFESGDPNRVAKVLRANPTMDTEDIKRIADMTDPGNLAKMAQLLERDDVPDEVKDNLLRFAKLQGGIDDEAVAKANFQEGRTFRQGLMNTASGSAAMSGAIKGAIETSVKAQASGKGTEGGLDTAIAGGLSYLKGTLPTGAEQALQDMLGIDAESYQQLDAFTKYIMLAATKPMLQGQGTVTDAERMMMASTVPRADQSFEARMELLNRLDVLNQMDMAHAKYYDKYKADAYHSNYEQLSGDIGISAGEAMNELYRARSMKFAMEHADLPKTSYASMFRVGDREMTPGEKMSMIAPRLNDTSARMYMEMLPTVTVNGKKYGIFADSVTGKIRQIDLEKPDGK